LAQTDAAEAMGIGHTTFNMAVGNADAHAKNFSVLHELGGPAVRFAPIYDVLSTIALELTDSAGQPIRADTHLGQRVGGQADVRKVTARAVAPPDAATGTQLNGKPGRYPRE
jgi:serine/threonine protein kinase HipA of HipAB toxin-antitoxin module